MSWILQILPNSLGTTWGIAKSAVCYTELKANVLSLNKVIHENNGALPISIEISEQIFPHTLIFDLY